MKYRYVVGTKKDPYYNLAMEQSLMEFVDEQTSVVFLWQNDKTIVVGRNQDVNAVCDKEKFLDWGGRIARRRSGGGAVYHDMGNLNYSLLSTSLNKEKLLYQDLMLTLMKQYAVEAAYNGRNDILIDGRKISGNAEYTDGLKVCQHGTILVQSDIHIMTRFLTPSVSKMTRNHVSSIGSRVMNLCDVIEHISVQSIIENMIQITGAEELNQTVDLKSIKDNIEFYSDAKWVYGGKK